MASVALQQHFEDYQLESLVLFKCHVSILHDMKTLCTICKAYRVLQRHHKHCLLLDAMLSTNHKRQTCDGMQLIL